MDDVRHIIMRSSTKSCSLDPVPTPLVVEYMDEPLPVITLIINSSLQSGLFPWSMERGNSNTFIEEL